MESVILLNSPLSLFFALQVASKKKKKIKTIKKNTANRENSVATKVFRFICHFLHICLLDFRPHPFGRLLIYFVVLAGPLVSIVFF